MQLVGTVTVGSGGPSTIEFTNIPQSGKDLLLLVSSRDNNQRFYVGLNGGAYTTFSFRRLLGDGSSVSSGSSTTITVMSTSNGHTGNTFGNAAIMITNYTSNNNKSISVDAVTENNATLAYQMIGAGTSNATAAVTSVAVGDTIFEVGSSASLYIIS